MVWVSPATSLRGGDKAARPVGHPRLGLGLLLSEISLWPGRLLPGELSKQTHCQAVQEAVPQNQYGKRSEPKAGRDQKKRGGRGRARGRTWTIRNWLPKRPHSCSAESEACGREREQDPRAPTTATRCRGQVRALPYALLPREEAQGPGWAPGPRLVSHGEALASFHR